MNIDSRVMVPVVRCSALAVPLSNGQKDLWDIHLLNC